MFFKPKTCLLCIAYTGVTYVRWKTSQSNNVHRFVWINIARIVRLGNYVNFLFTSCVCFPSPTPFSPSPFSPFNTHHFLSRVLSPMKCRCRAPPFVCLFAFVCMFVFLFAWLLCLFVFVRHSPHSRNLSLAPSPWHRFMPPPHSTNYYLSPHPSCPSPPSPSLSLHKLSALRSIPNTSPTHASSLGHVLTHFLPNSCSNP